MEVNKEYDVKHPRKGDFSGILLKQKDDTSSFKITKGRIKHISVLNNQLGIGDIVHVKTSYCIFKERIVGDAKRL